VSGQRRRARETSRLAEPGGFRDHGPSGVSTDRTDFSSLRRENEVLRARVTELERMLARFDDGVPAETGASLAEREALLSEAERIAHMGCWVWDPVGGGARWSDEMYRIWGYEPGEVVPTLELFHAGIHPDDFPRFQAASDRGLTSGKAEQVEFRVIQPSGAVRRVSMSSMLLFDDQGNPRRAMGTALDMTERESLEEQLRHAQKMEAVGRLAGGVAHDFNNLLTVIIGCSEQLQMERPSEELDSILQAAEAAASLTRQLLAFSRRAVLDPRTLDLNAEIRKTQGLLERAVGESVRVVTDLEEELWPVLLDVGHLQQMLLNIAVNARDAMPDGGTLTIRTRNLPSNGGGNGSDRRVEMTLTDTGHGMDADTLKRVFEPFFTTKAPGAGTGLGMSMVFGAVEQHGGTATIESEPGEGTSVRLCFPRAEERPMAQELSVDVDVTLDRLEQGALVVDDDAAVLGVVVRHLGERSVPVEQATDAERALALLAERDFDLLIVDVRMPNVSGIELARRARARRPGLPVLFMTGYAGTEIEKLELARPWSLIEKPFQSRDLLGAIAELCASRLAPG